LQRLHAVLLLLLLRGLRALPGVLLLLLQEGRLGTRWCRHCSATMPSSRYDQFVVDTFCLWRRNVINLELFVEIKAWAQWSSCKSHLLLVCHVSTLVIYSTLVYIKGCLCYCSSSFYEDTGLCILLYLYSRCLCICKARDAELQNSSIQWMHHRCRGVFLLPMILLCS
jgi:hypothetical protein